MEHITKLTDEQKERVFEFHQEWVDRCSTGKGVTEQEQKESINNAYRSIGEEPPIILTVSSPMAMTMCQWMILDGLGLHTFEELKKLHPLKDRIWRHLGVRLWNQLEQHFEDQAGFEVRRYIWDRLGTEIRAQLSDQLFVQVRDKLRSDVMDKLKVESRTETFIDSLNSSLDFLFRDNYYAFSDAMSDDDHNYVWDNLSDNLWLTIGNNLHEVVRDQIEYEISEALHTKIDAQLWCGWWASSVSWLRFAVEIGVELDKEMLDTVCGVPMSIFVMAPYRGICIVSKHPSHVSRDERGRLHNESGPAVRFSDGYSLWAWHGVRVPQQIIESPETIDPEDILGEPNVEVRRVMISQFGEERLLKELNAECVSQDDYGELYRLPLENDEPIVMVRVSCPSTGRVYFERVPPEVETPRQALAWQAGVAENDYILMAES